MNATCGVAAVNIGTAAGAGNGRIIHHGIPTDLREAARRYAVLIGRGEPVPDDIRKKHNEYKKWVRYGGKDPAGIPRKASANSYIPEDLRKALAEYNRLHAAGADPPRDVIEKANEYARWRAHGGPPPEKRRRLPKPHEVEWPYSAYLEWHAMLKKGVPPGEIPAKVAEGYAKYLGVPVRKYTPCCPPGKKNGQGCRGRHGDGPMRIPFAPGVAHCTPCQIAYRNVPDDVTRCGCCGKVLRKNPRNKSARL